MTCFYRCSFLLTVLWLSAASLGLAADQLVSITADHEPVASVCARLSRQVGQPIGVPGTEARITLNLTNVPFAQAIRAVAGAADLACIRTEQGWVLKPPPEVLNAIDRALQLDKLPVAWQLWLSLPHSGIQRLLATAPHAQTMLELACRLADADRLDDARRVWQQALPLTQRLDALAAADDMPEKLHLLRRAQRLSRQLGNEAEADATATFIRSLLGSTRILKLVAAVDARATYDPLWRRKIRNRIRFCSGLLEKQFGIRLQIVATVVWEAPDIDPGAGPADFLKLLADLADACPLGYKGAELILGFLCVPLSADADHFPESMVFGMAPPRYRGYVVVCDVSIQGTEYYQAQGQVHQAPTQLVLSPAAVRQTLLHELGHAFGCLHTDDKNSVMRPGVNTCLEFDAKNAAVMRAAKWMNIAKGPSSLDEPELLDLLDAYQGLEGACAQGNGAELYEAECYLALGDLYVERRQLQKAASAYQAVIDLHERVAPHLKIIDAGGTDMLARAARQAQQALETLSGPDSAGN